jgi:hypothetical protein
LYKSYNSSHTRFGCFWSCQTHIGTLVFYMSDWNLRRVKQVDKMRFSVVALLIAKIAKFSVEIAAFACKRKLWTLKVFTATFHFISHNLC